MSPQRLIISGVRMRSSVANMPLGTVSHTQSFLIEIFGVKLNSPWQYSRKAVTSVGSSKFLAESRSFKLSITFRVKTMVR